MRFTPRLLADGRICCSAPTALCEKCKAHFAQVGRRAVPPPDPYAGVGLRAAEIADALDPRIDPAYEPYGTPPDPYRHRLALRTLLDQEDR